MLAAAGPRRPTSAGARSRATGASTAASNAPRHVPPTHVYGRRQGCSVIGGYVVRDRRLGRRLRGRYLYGDFCSGEIRSLRMSGGHARAARSENVIVPGMSSFGHRHPPPPLRHIPARLPVPPAPRASWTAARDADLTEGYRRKP